MDEAQWFASDDPAAMLAATDRPLGSNRPHGPWTERKEGLFGAACCRLVWPLIAGDERCRRVITSLEARSDWRLSEQPMWDAKQAADDGSKPELESLAANMVYDCDSPRLVLNYILRGFNDWGDPKHRPRKVADIMRDIIGNPFRAVAFDPSWRTSTAVALAAGIYARRAFTRLPILGDALEDAGCDGELLLGHCRGPGPHVRGCWVVDLVLGKE